MSDRLLPVALKLAGRSVTVVGAGPVGLRKTRDLLEVGARVTVVAPEAVAELRALAEEGTVQWIPRGFRPGDLDRATLVFVATDDPGVSAEVVTAAHQRRLLVNVADVPEQCDFYLTAVVRRGPVAVAVSSGGASPALARGLADELERTLPRSLGRHAELLREARELLRARYPDEPTRRHALGRALHDGRVAELVAQGREDEARALLRRIVEGLERGTEPGGEGEGP